MQSAYSVNDVVYLLESAAIGMIEAHTIIEVKQSTDGRILYKVRSGAMPQSLATVGDRIGNREFSVLYFLESELVPYCQALDLAIANAQRQLTYLNSLKAACPDITNGT